MLPAVLAAAEVAGASGRAVIAAAVLAYEIYGHFADRFATREKGWDQGSSSAWQAPAPRERSWGCRLTGSPTRFP